ncbi:DUF5808 domain-containing protein [Clostridium massiliamazoniense]|uniref:DUF5808 domain-containing protein n=1 Tax=Clostridium massiliamazoniense TaxID=1347366 RepID=UPI0006D796CB|nr:DUF5808 domain-containing protein [Clostridium massiliamazoniense]
MEKTTLILNLIVNMIILLSIFMACYYVNDLKGQGRLLFGIRLPKDYSNDSKILALKNKYKINFSLASISLFILSCIFLGNINLELAMVTSTVGIAVISIIFYYIGYKKLLNIKNSENWSKLSSKKVYVSIESPENSQYINLYWFVIPLIMGIISLILTLLLINKLPNEVPLHFGFNGADEFAMGSKLSTKLQVLILPLVNLFVTFMTFASVKNHIKKPEKLNGGSISEAKNYILKEKKNTSIFTLLTNFIVSSILLYTNLAVIGLTKMNFYSLILIVLLPILVILISIPLFVHNNHTSTNKINGDEEDIYIDDDSSYKFGGLFYYNKNNPSTFVPKRMGIGYTINCASTGGKLFWIVFALFIIAVIFLGHN